MRKNNDGAVIFRAWRLVNGEKLYAKDYGLKAWRIPLSGKNPKK
jgi:hypothetical protein